MKQRQVVRSSARRGATLVMVSVCIVVLGGMAAFAVDLARIYSGVNELQTGSDAAALAGARRLQMRPTESPVSHTVSFAGSNNAFGAPISVASEDVVTGFWNPDSGTFTPAALSLSNAIRVRSARSALLGFGRFVGLDSLTPARSGTAWIGNQASRDCIKPWGFDLAYINSLLGSGFDITTQAGVNELGRLTASPEGRYQMTIIASPDINNPRDPPTPTAAPTIFSALTGATSSRKEYMDAIIGQSCDNSADYFVGGAEDMIGEQPGQGNGDIPRATHQAVELDMPPGRTPPGAVATCAPQVGNDATCFAPGSTDPGITVTVAAVTPVSVNSAQLRMFLQFKLMCVFRGRLSAGQPGGARAAETCPWLTDAGREANAYVEGTLVGYPMISVALTGPGNGLGNTIGTAQKLVLVQ